MIQNGRSDKVAAFIAGDGNAAAIQNQLGSLVNSPLNPVANGSAVLFTDHRAELCFGVIGTADLHRHCFLLQHHNKLVGNTLLHYGHRKRHAAHAGAAICGIDDGVGGTVQIAVLQNQRMVFGLALSLYALPMGGSNGINVLANLSGPHEGNRFYSGICQQSLGFAAAAGDQINNPFGKTALFIKQLHDTHGGQRGLGGRL